MNDAPRPSGSEQPNRGPDIERLLMLLEAAATGSRELDARVLASRFATEDEDYWHIWMEHPRCPQFTTSLDAAMTLVPDGLFLDLHDWTWSEAPCWCASLQSIVGTCIHVGAKGATAALAVCRAALSANAHLLKSVPSLSPTPARGASSPESSLPESTNQSETP